MRRALMLAMVFVFSLTSIASAENVWEQYKGENITLNFISENTPPTSAVANHIDEFTELTGIEVNVTQLPLEDVVQKVALDFAAGSATYQVIYADPYQILAPFFPYLANLNQFINDTSLPSLPNGLDDFIPSQTIAAGRMISPTKLYALPYDAPTIIWFYRKDIFKKYKDEFMADKGYDWTPGDHLTWEQYYEIAKWINENAPEVEYGTAHQAKQHDSLMNDFSNILWSYGGRYFDAPNIGGLGTTNPGESLLDEPEAIEAARFYKKLIDIAHPGSTSWDWNGLAEPFAAGEVAMIPEWHEFAATFEDPNKSKVVGKVGFAPLPHGPTGKSYNMWGGTGIAINANASRKEQRAAWLFIVWATSPEVQKLTLKEEGGTPTRLSVYNDPEVMAARTPPSNMPNMLTADAVLTAWDEDHIGLRPKIPTWVQVDTVIYTELSNMLAGRKSPEEAMRDAARQIDEITGAQ